MCLITTRVDSSFMVCACCTRCFGLSGQSLARPYIWRRIGLAISAIRLKQILPRFVLLSGRLAFFMVGALPLCFGLPGLSVKHIVLILMWSLSLGRAHALVAVLPMTLGSHISVARRASSVAGGR